jgi:hypothetical protein
MRQLLLLLQQRHKLGYHYLQIKDHKVLQEIQAQLDLLVQLVQA